MQLVLTDSRVYLGEREDGRPDFVTLRRPSVVKMLQWDEVLVQVALTKPGPEHLKLQLPRVEIPIAHVRVVIDCAWG